MFDTGKDKG
jgi:hypothetical protein